MKDKEECFADGTCMVPQYIPLISTQTVEQKLGLNSEGIEF